MNFLKESTAITKLTFSIIITGFCFLFFSLIALLLALPVFNISFIELYNNLQYLSDTNISLLKFFQGFQSSGLFLIPPVLIGFLLYKNSNEILFWNKKPGWQQAGLTLLLMVSLFPVINFLAAWNAGMALPEFLAGVETWIKEKEELAKKITLAFLQVENLEGYLVNLLIIAIIPAVGEEFLFRGVLQKQFSDILQNKHAGIIFSALIFSAIHLQFYGFIPRFFLGLLFGYLLIWTGNIWLPILAHLINNSTAVTFYYFADTEKIENQIETFGTNSSTLAFTLFASFFVAFICYIFYIKRV